MSIGIIQAVCTVLFINSVGIQATTDVAQLSRLANTVALSPQKLEFDSQAVGTSGQPKTATLTNTSNTNVAVRDISASGIDFTETNNCPANLAPGANCKIEVTFTPAVTGPRLGTIIVSASNPANPLFLVLSGTGE